MKPSTSSFRRILRDATLGLGLAAIVGGASVAPAMAGDYWHPDRRDAYSHQDRRDVRQPVWRAHERWEPRYAYAAPRYGYGYGYAPPAPAYVAPPSLNFVFPIR